MKKLVLFLMALVLGTSAFAVDVDTIVKSSKYMPLIMMQSECEDEDVVAITGIMLVNMNENMLEYMPTGEMANLRYTNWPEEETTNFIEAFLYFLYDNTQMSSYLVLQKGSTLIKSVLPNVDDVEARKIVMAAYVQTVYELQ